MTATTSASEKRADAIPALDADSQHPSIKQLLRFSPPLYRAVPPKSGRLEGHPKMEDEHGLPPDAFTKLDDEDDEIFYQPPSVVCHMADGAIAALTGFCRKVLPADGVLLEDLVVFVVQLRKGVRRQPVLIL